jgi:hypothetical protein
MEFCSQSARKGVFEEIKCNCSAVDSFAQQDMSEKRSESSETKPTTYSIFLGSQFLKKWCQPSYCAADIETLIKGGRLAMSSEQHAQVDGTSGGTHLDLSFGR